MPVRAPSAAAAEFATRIARASHPSSDGYRNADGVHDGTLVLEEEASHALAALAGQPDSVHSSAIRDVLERITKGELTFVEAAREAVVKEYLLSARAPTMGASPMATRLAAMGAAGVSKKPTLIVPEKDSAGGSSTHCAKVLLDNRVSFVKSNGGSQHMRTLYSNFESDILGGEVFKLLGLNAPQARVVDVSNNAAFAEVMGQHVLDMDFVDSKVAGGRLCPPPFDAWSLDPPDDDMHPTQYQMMFAVDLLFGNSDRRTANFFNADHGGTVVPVPIDNNCGLLSGLTNRGLTNHTNFLRTFGDPATKVDFSAVLPETLGGVRNIIADAPHYRQFLADPSLRATLLEQIDVLRATLTDDVIDRMVDTLPREIVPDDVEVVPWTEMFAKQIADGSLPEDWQDVMEIAYDGLDRPLSGDELFAARKQELKETLKWRRDNLRKAVEDVVAAGVDDG